MSARIALSLVLWVVCVVAASNHAPLMALQEPDSLPPGKGREILEAACTSCHEFEEILKLRGKLDRDQWRIVVRSMIDYGAEVDPKDVEVLVEYLDQHLGKR